MNRSHLLNFPNKKIFAVCLFLLGVFLLLRKSYLYNISVESITGFVFIIYSVITFYQAFNEGKREILIIVTILFLTGVELLVKTNIDIYDTRGFVFTSVLFISGSIFLVLFLENTKQKIFAGSGIFLIVLSYLSTTIFKKLGIFYLTNKIANLSGFFWPIVLIIFGISIFINRKK
jgi:hypothetical protein